MFHNLSQINWLVSLFAAIALSAAASLLGKLLTFVLAKLSSRLARSREERLQRELAELSPYRDHSGVLNLMLGSVMWVLVFFSLASATSTLSNLPERVLAEVPSIVLSALSTLFYLMSILRAWDTLSKLSKLRRLKAQTVSNA